jgi:hypothetical protein
MMRDFNPWDIKRPFSSTDKRPGRYVTGRVGFIVGPAVGVPGLYVGDVVTAVGVSGLDVGDVVLTSTPGVS